MKKLTENLANLVKVKTIVTLVVITVFAVLALKGTISADNVMIVISMVVSFYFGTQHEKGTGTVAGTGYGYTESIPEPAAVLQMESTQPEATEHELPPPMMTK